MGRVDVAYLKTGTFAGQTAWPKRRKTTLVRHFGQWVGLVHELRQLARAEEFAHSRGRGFRVDQVLWHHCVDFDAGHTFLDRTFHPQKANAILVFHQFTDGTHTAIAQVVNIVDVAAPVAQINKRLDAGNDVFLAQGAHGVFGIQRKAHVHFDPADGGQIIAFAVKEQRVKQGRGRFDGGRFTRTHHAVNVHQRRVAAHVLVRGQRVAHVGADGDIVDVQNRNFGHTRVDQFLDRAANDFAFFVVFQRQLITGFDIDRAVFFVDDVLGYEFADDLFIRQQKVRHLAFVDQLFDRARGHFLARFCDHFAGIGIDQIIKRPCAAHPVGEEFRHPALTLAERILHSVIIGVHDRFLIHPQRIKQGRHRKLAAAVDPGKHDVLGVEFEIEPRATVRNDPAGEQQLARAVRLALVMVKEHTGRPVHLGHDHPFGAVDHKSAVRGHQGHVAHEHVLFLDVLDRLCAGVFVDIKHDQTQRDLQRGAVGHVALHTFLNVVLRLFQFVFHEFQMRRFVEILDREHRLEHAHDAFAVRRIRLVARFQEKFVRAFLNLNKVRHFENFANFTIVFAKPFLTEEGLSHDECHLSFLTGTRAAGLRRCVHPR